MWYTLCTCEAVFWVHSASHARPWIIAGAAHYLYHRLPNMLVPIKPRSKFLKAFRKRMMYSPTRAEVVALSVDGASLISLL